MNLEVGDNADAESAHITEPQQATANRSPLADLLVPVPVELDDLAVPEIDGDRHCKMNNLHRTLRNVQNRAARLRSCAKMQLSGGVVPLSLKTIVIWEIISKFLIFRFTIKL